jgi:hypothetical protein
MANLNSVSGARKQAPGKPTKAPSWRDILKIHPAAELFPLMLPAELRELGKDIEANGLKSPVALWSDGKSPAVLLDGRNRLDAIEIATGIPVEIGAPSIMAGKDFLACDKVIVLDKSVDPYAYVISANIHRRHLDAEQKRWVIGNLILAFPDKSDRQIAEMIRVSHHTVASVRTEMERRGQIAHVETRTDTKGRRQRAKKADGRKKATNPPPQVSEEVLQKREEAAERIRALMGNPTGDDVGPDSGGEDIDADAPMLSILFKAWDRASEPVRQKFMARVGLAPDPLAIPPYLDRRTREVAP